MNDLDRIVRGFARARRAAPVAAIAILLVVALPSGLSADARRVNTPAFDFALVDVNPASPTHGDTLRLSDLYTRDGLVVNFIASWCAPCRFELPMMQSLHVDGDVPVLCVAADESGGPEDIVPLLRATGLTTPVLFAPGEAAETLARHYDYRLLPSTYLIDGAGRIRSVFEGLVDEATLRREIAVRLR